MSAAKDEAEDGPLNLENEDNGIGEKTSQNDENEQTQEEELLTPKLSKPNGFGEEDDSLASNNEVESEDFGPLQTSSPVPERPSSADESLSIPDDTPSLQVRSARVEGGSVLTALGFYRVVLPKKKGPHVQLWSKSNTLSTTL